MELWTEINSKLELLDKAIEQLANNGNDKAKKERDYKIALCKKALQLRDEGMPVTLIQTTIYGFEDIANLRLERDLADVKYQANQEYINDTKLTIKILESQLNREWGNSNK